MDYRRFISPETMNFKINDHLVECGRTTWQIRNIAATTISSKKAPFNVPEPKFDLCEPQLEIRWALIVIVFFIVWLVVSVFMSSPNLGGFLAITATLPVFYLAWEARAASKVAWLNAKAKHDHNWSVWDAMRANPLILHKLMLETNAGSKPLFYSLDEQHIIKVNDAIKNAMTKKESSEIQFNIETVNVGADDSINNFSSSIYTQSIQEA